jgi:hypothetical protein
MRVPNLSTGRTAASAASVHRPFLSRALAVAVMAAKKSAIPTVPL